MSKFNLAAMVKNGRRNRMPRPIRNIIPNPILAGEFLRTVYKPLMSAWLAQIPAIVAEYEYTLGELTLDSPESVSAAIGSAEGNLSSVITQVGLAIREWVAKVELRHRKKWTDNVKAATSINLETLLTSGDVKFTLSSAIEGNVGLVTSVSDQVRDRIKQSVFTAIQQKQSVRDLAKELRNNVALGRTRAELIASDQMSKISSQLDRDRAQQAGLEYYEWVHSGKVHYRAEHKARNGKRYKYGEPSGDEPGMAIRCGCTARAVLTLDGEF